jgi:hypothetical protein
VSQRRKTEKVTDRKKVVWPGAGPWSPEVALCPYPQFFFFFVPGVGAVDPSLGGM